MYRKTYVLINLDNIKNNIKAIISHYKYNYYIGVVKGNAYGHGEYVVKEMINNGINYLAVSTLEEAIRIRKYDNNIPILCLQPIELEFMNECIKNNVTITIHDRDYFDKLMDIELQGKLKMHLKIDSGMNRIGIKDKDEVNYIYQLANQNKNIILEGVYSHFATSGVNDKQWDNQLSKFKYLLSDIDLKTIPIIHFGKSVTVLNHEKIDICNGIRTGIIMYGYNQTPVFSNSIRGRLIRLKRELRIKLLGISKTNIQTDLKFLPALSLYSNIIQIKDVKKGEYIGYGSGARAKTDMKIGVIPIGHADGFNQRNKGRDVIINKKRYHLFGEVGMGMVDVIVDDTVKVGDKVTLIGDGISIREVGRYTSSSIYEVMSSIQKVVPRVYVKDNKEVYIEELK
jgi:alanine racemase